MLPDFKKVYISHLGMSKASFEFNGIKYMIVQTKGLIFNANDPEEMKILNFFSRQKFIGITNNIDPVELNIYLATERFAPRIEKDIKHGDNIIDLTKWEPDDEAKIIANLRKRGYEIAPKDKGFNFKYDIRTAAKFLEGEGYIVTAPEEIASAEQEKEIEKPAEEVKADGVITYTKADLQKKYKPELVVICKSYEVSKNGTNKSMINRILKAQKE